MARAPISPTEKKLWALYDQHGVQIRPEWHATYSRHFRLMKEYTNPESNRKAPARPFAGDNRGSIGKGTGSALVS